MSSSRMITEQETLDALISVQVWDANGKLAGSFPLHPSPRLETVDLLLERSRSSAWRRVLESGAFTQRALLGGRALEVQWLPLRTPSGALSGAVSLVFDEETSRRTQMELSRRLEFETLITELSTHFIGLEAREIDRGINQALRAIGEFCGVDRAYLFQFSSDGTAMNNTHEWCAPGIDPQLESLQGLPLEMFPWWIDRIRRRQVVHVPRVLDMPEEAAAEKQILLDQQIRAVVAVPTLYRRAVLGFLGFDSVRAEKTWPDEDIALLKIVGEMLVSALERRRADEARSSLEAQLVQARSLENVTKLAGGVAHDFNNLLAVILNYGTLLEREMSDPKLKEWLSELVRSAKQAAHLTRQLLIVGRRGLVDRTVIELNERLQALEDLLRRTLGESVQLELELDEATGFVQIGVPQLEQVVVNLALNARAALPSGGTVTVSTAGVELDEKFAARHIDVAPGRYARVTFRDSGVGMPADVAARAFEPFFTTRGATGTGLGLSTVHAILSQAGGHVSLESSPGRGTCVTLYLPTVTGAAMMEPSGGPVGPVDRGHGETVLVVEDNGSLRALVCDMLRANGYLVLEAEDPIEALRVCAQNAGQIDLILTDVIMPKMSGRTFADAARERHGITRAAYVSGYDDDVLANHGVLQEGIHLLQKPFAEEELLRFVRYALDGA